MINEQINYILLPILNAFFLTFSVCVDALEPCRLRFAVCFGTSVSRQGKVLLHQRMKTTIHMYKYQPGSATFTEIMQLGHSRISLGNINSPYVYDSEAGSVVLQIRYPGSAFVINSVGQKIQEWQLSFGVLIGCWTDKQRVYMLKKARAEVCIVYQNNRKS